MEPVLRMRFFHGAIFILGLVHVVILVQLWTKKEVHPMDRGDEVDHFAPHPWKVSRELSIQLVEGKGSKILQEHNIDEDPMRTPSFKGEPTTRRNDPQKQSIQKTDGTISRDSIDSNIGDNSQPEDETEPPTDPDMNDNKQLTDHRAMNAKMILDRIQKNKEEQKRNQRNLPKITRDDPSILRLKEQGIEFNETDWQDIPPWSQITNIYGEEPVILGLESCAEYRRRVPARNRVVAPAGNFNTGTNLFSYFFGKNCQGLSAMQFVQVPWGKHNLARARLDGYRANHTKYENFPLGHVLPVVLTRHPVSWMFSTCRHSYASYWNHTDQNCPHLYNEYANKTNTVYVAYGYRKPGKKYHQHKTLIHFWNDWYQSYANPLPFPRVIVRLEDIVYQPAKVLEKLCECAGGTLIESKVLVPEESVKVRKDRMRNKTGLPGSLVRGKETAGLVKAWKDHARIAELWDRISRVDKSIVQKLLPEGKGLLHLFHYKLVGEGRSGSGSIEPSRTN